jgi:hypothetical protein
MEFFRGMLDRFGRDYWATQCGQDAYLYLLFQRKLMRLMVVIGGASMIVSLSSNLFSAPSR